MINYIEFKENLARFCGNSWTELQNNKFSVPCSREHGSLKPFGHPNIIYDPVTDFGECNACGWKTNGAELLTAIEAKFTEQNAKNKEAREAAASSSSHLLSVSEILAMEFSEMPWLIERILPAPGIMALSGIPGDFKSWLTLHMALSVARGTPVFGKFVVQQGAVLVIDEENHLRHIQTRLRLLGANAADPIFYQSFGNFKADNEKKVAAVLKKAKENGVKLIILDSLVNVHDQDENDAGGISKVFQGIKKFLAEDISVIFIHHHRKNNGFGQNNPAQSLRGSTNILAEVDSHVSVERKPNEDILVLKHNKSRHAEALAPMEIKIIKNAEELPAPTGFEFIGTLDEKKRKAEEAAEAVEMLLTEGIKSRQEIEASLASDFGKGAVNDGVKLCEKNSTVERVPKKDLPSDLQGQNRKHFYRLIPQQENEDSELPSLPEP
jgi:hypothetical protein